MARALPTDETVRGDFNTQFRLRAPLRRTESFVNTETGDGGLADFEIKHTFRIRPLQQTLKANRRDRIR